MANRHFSTRGIVQVGVALLAVGVLWKVVGCGRQDPAGGTAGTATTAPGGAGSTQPGGGSVVNEAGFTPLFNGQSLDGWQAGNQVLNGQTASPDKRFQSKDGMLVIMPTDKDGNQGNKDIYLAQPSNTNFILKLEFRAGEEALGYVMVRNYPVMIGDARRLKQDFKHFKNDDWNELIVVVRQVTRAGNRALNDGDALEAAYQGHKATATLNGKAIDPNSIWVGLQALPMINGETLIGGSFSVPTSGKIGLRAFTGRIDVRNVRVKEMP